MLNNKTIVVHTSVFSEHHVTKIEYCQFEYTNCVLMMEVVLSSETTTMFNYRDVVFVEDERADNNNTTKIFVHL